MPDVAQTGRHKKWVRRSSLLNAKKLYEDAQMAQKVKQYLSNLELDMDEKSLQTLSLQCQPATSTLPNNSRDKKPVKTETTPVAPHAGPQQKVRPQQPLAQPQAPYEVSQGLQVPTVSLYPSQKKVLVKELPPFGINSPRASKKILSLSEEESLERLRKQAEDTISTASSQLSSPPTSPQSSPRKDYALALSGTMGNVSDSGHSEICSRSSITTNSSFDLVPVSLHDEWHQRNFVTIVKSNLSVGRMQWQILMDQYTLGSYAPVSESRGLYATEMVISSSSRSFPMTKGTILLSMLLTEVMGAEHHAQMVLMPTYRPFSTREAGKHCHLGTLTLPIQGMLQESSTGYWGEDSETNTGTIKRSGGKDVSAEGESSSMVPVTTEEAKPVPMPVHIAVTPSTIKELMARKEGRYREPPPTPPGYMGIPIADFPEGSCHKARKFPAYNMALQWSHIVTWPTETPAPDLKHPKPQPCGQAASCSGTSPVLQTRASCPSILRASREWRRMKMNKCLLFEAPWSSVSHPKERTRRCPKPWSLGMHI